MNIDVEDRLHRQLPGIADRAGLPVVQLDQVMGRVGRRRRRRAIARGATAMCGPGLSPSVATVELRQGADVSWQHVVDGVAAFPVQAHEPSDEVVAFDAAGVEVLRASWSTVTLTGESTTVAADGSSTQPMYTWSSTFGTEAGELVPEVDATTLEGMTQADEDAYRAFADATMRQCLVDEGSATWNTCLVSTDAAVEAYLSDRP